mmetsp:Transcript_21496/g.81858  ORF Transcript_21496/g.81858 Transcript_21496/m.81858 type:complete len:233 (-) Transcript_21496:565-1263(-)
MTTGDAPAMRMVSWRSVNARTLPLCRYPVRPPAPARATSSSTKMSCASFCDVVTPHASAGVRPRTMPGAPAKEAPTALYPESFAVSDSACHTPGLAMARCGSFSKMAPPDSVKLPCTTKLFDASTCSGDKIAASSERRSDAVGFTLAVQAAPAQSADETEAQPAEASEARLVEAAATIGSGSPASCRLLDVARPEAIACCTAAVYSEAFDRCCPVRSPKVPSCWDSVESTVG